MSLLKEGLFLCLIMCMCVEWGGGCACECRHLQSPEEVIGSPIARVTVMSCSMWVLGTELGSSVRAVHATSHSVIPSVPMCLVVVGGGGSGFVFVLRQGLTL